MATKKSKKVVAMQPRPDSVRQIATRLAAMPTAELEKLATGGSDYLHQKARSVLSERLKGTEGRPSVVPKKPVRPPVVPKRKKGQVGTLAPCLCNFLASFTDEQLAELISVPANDELDRKAFEIWTKRRGIVPSSLCLPYMVQSNLNETVKARDELASTRTNPMKKNRLANGKVLPKPNRKSPQALFELANKKSNFKARREWQAWRKSVLKALRFEGIKHLREMLAQESDFVIRMLIAWSIGDREKMRQNSRLPKEPASVSVSPANWAKGDTRKPNKIKPSIGRWADRNLRWWESMEQDWWREQT